MGNKIMEYYVIYEEDRKTFATRVTKLLNDGWTLAGHLQVVQDGAGKLRFYQSVTRVKYEEPV